jgi:hypothetical protein
LPGSVKEQHFNNWFAFVRVNSRLDFWLTCSSALFASRFFGAHWRWLTGLSYQPEAHRISAYVASRERLALSHQDIMRLPMLVVNHLINAALAAECARKKIVSGTDAFHRTSSLKPAAESGRTRVREQAVRSLDDGPAISGGAHRQ